MPPNNTNLDFFAFANDPAIQHAMAAPPIKTEPQPTDWEKLLGSLDNGQTNIFDACYGGQPVEVLNNYAPPQPINHRHSTSTLNNHNSALDWNADLWNLYQTNTQTSLPAAACERPAHNDSVWSYSTDEGTASAEDLTAQVASWSGGSSDVSGHNDSADAFPGIVLPDLGLGGDELNFPFSEWGDVGA